MRLQPKTAWLWLLGVTCLAAAIGAAVALAVSRPDARTQASSPSSAEAALEQDSVAKSNARNLVSQIESCAVDYAGEYTSCGSDQLQNTGLEIGSGPEQVETTQTGSSTYTVVATSQSGNTFTITKGPSGVSTRSCVTAAEGGCGPDGAW